MRTHTHTTTVWRLEVKVRCLSLFVSFLNGFSVNLRLTMSDGLAKHQASNPPASSSYALGKGCWSRIVYVICVVRVCVYMKGVRWHLALYAITLILLLWGRVSDQRASQWPESLTGLPVAAFLQPWCHATPWAFCLVLPIWTQLLMRAQQASTAEPSSQALCLSSGPWGRTGTSLTDFSSPCWGGSKEQLGLGNC